MANGNKKGTGPSTGPDFALRQSDAEYMSRALKGVTTSRSAGIAHQGAVRQLGHKKGSHPIDK